MARFLVVRLLVVAICGLSAGVAWGISPDPRDLAISPQDSLKARGLIRRLGSEVYREREDAQTELAQMGRLARPALIEAVSSDPDPEIRFRCSRLLPRAGAEDLKARLETFLADADGKYEHSLPALKQFRKIVGADKMSRELYVEIFKSPYNVELLEMLDKGPAEAGPAVAERRVSLFSQTQQIVVNGRLQQGQVLSLADIACVLFAETVVPSKNIPRNTQRNNMWSFVSGVYFLNQQASLAAIRGGDVPHSEAYKRLLGQWMETRDDITEMNQLPDMIGQQLRGFKETVPLLRRIANTETAAGYGRARALFYLMQIKGKEELPFVQSFLKSQAITWNMFVGNPANNQTPCQLRDFALAILITQNNQKLSDYGFIFPQGIAEPNMVNGGMSSFAFPNEQARSAAMMKFAFWQMKHGDKEGSTTAPKATPAPAPTDKK